jgi:hypothetical protein
VLSLALLLCSCANVEYTAYFGQQQNWPMASGSFVQRKFELPVYLGRQIRRIACLAIWKRKVLPWPCGKPAKVRVLNQQ